MKILRLALALLLLIPFTLLHAAVPANGPTAVVDRYFDLVNAGDVEAAFKLYAMGSISITNDFAPSVWIGPSAPMDFLASLTANLKAHGITEPNARYSDPTRVQIDGSTAYLVLPVAYSFTQNGVRLSEDGLITFALVMEDGGWKIRAWTWTAIKAPQPVK